MRVRVNGPFRVFDQDDADVTPKGIKERGLLALLLLSPGQRRTRAWLQDRLWSTSTAERASGSCRQALANLRKALGPLAGLVRSDRTAIWITPQVPLQIEPHLGEALSDLEIADPEFTDWVCALRMQQDSPPVSTALTPPALDREASVVICRIDRSATARGAFILAALSQRIAGEISSTGGLAVSEFESDERVTPDLRHSAQVELECLDESDVAFILLRVIGHPNRRIVWSGRLTIGPGLSTIWQCGQVSRAVNRIVQAVFDMVANASGRSTRSLFQRAIRLKFEYDRASLTRADELLDLSMAGDLKALSMSWRAMIRLVELVEFRENDADRMAEAVEFSEHAARLLPNNPSVLAFASELQIWTTADFDKANFYAGRAMDLDDHHPEALAALGRVLSFEGRNDRAVQLASGARDKAQGMMNDHEWDLMAGAAKARLGDMNGAQDMVLSCHRKSPFSRHALRYLIVLAILDDRSEDALHYTDRLRRLEPDFSLALLAGDYRPLSGKPDFELMQNLRQKIATL